MLGNRIHRCPPFHAPNVERRARRLRRVQPGQIRRQLRQDVQRAGRAIVAPTVAAGGLRGNAKPPRPQGAMHHPPQPHALDHHTRAHLTLQAVHHRAHPPQIAQPFLLAVRHQPKVHRQRRQQRQHLGQPQQRGHAHTVVADPRPVQFAIRRVVAHAQVGLRPKDRIRMRAHQQRRRGLSPRPTPHDVVKPILRDITQPQCVHLCAHPGGACAFRARGRRDLLNGDAAFDQRRHRLRPARRQLLHLAEFTWPVHSTLPGAPHAALARRGLPRPNDRANKTPIEKASSRAWDEACSRFHPCCR